MIRNILLYTYAKLCVDLYRCCFLAARPMNFCLLLPCRAWVNCHPRNLKGTFAIHKYIHVHVFMYAYNITQILRYMYMCTCITYLDVFQ
jgi:hypothetical protein